MTIYSWGKTIKTTKVPIAIKDFKLYIMSGTVLWTKLSAAGIGTPMGMLDNTYYYTDEAGWKLILGDLVQNSTLYQTDVYDCPLPYDLAFSFGLFYADGSSSVNNDKKTYNWYICNSNKELLERCVEPLIKEFGFDFKIHSYPSERKGTITNFGVRNKDIYRLQTNIGAGNRRLQRREPFIRAWHQMFYTEKGRKKVPGCIMESPLETKWAFIDGVIEGDAYKKGHMLGVKNKYTLMELYIIMDELSLNPKVYPEPRKEDFWYLHYSFLNKHNSYIARFLEDKEWTSVQTIANEFKMSNGMVGGILKGMEKKGNIIFQKPWSQRKEVKLVKGIEAHCDKFAMKARVLAFERYGLNTCGFVIGDIPAGRHSFNLIVTTTGFLLFEPQNNIANFGVFPLDGRNYHADVVLI
jgi:hypothetical protein